MLNGLHRLDPVSWLRVCGDGITMVYAPQKPTHTLDTQVLGPSTQQLVYKR